MKTHPSSVTMIEWHEMAKVVIRKTTYTGFEKGPAILVATFDRLPDAREHLRWIKRKKPEGAHV